MILRALYEYYQNSAKLPPPGMEAREFKYMILLEKDGGFIDLVKLLDEQRRGRLLTVPRSFKRSGTKSEKYPFLLWDTVDFVLGQSGKGELASDKDTETAQRKRANFIEKIKNLPENLKATPQIGAVLNFYKKEEYAKLPSHALWEELLKSKSNLTFILRYEDIPVASIEAVAQFCAQDEDSADNDESGNALKGRCLVTGEFASLSRLAGATPILGSKSNASLIGFQKNSGYDSYGKEQGYNAPIAQTTEFALTTALKSLLSKDSNHCMLIGGLTLLFWTAEDKPVLTGMFQQLIGSHQKKEENLQDLRALYDSVFTGKMPKGELENRFYLLGMAPNSARISVVLWKNGNVKQLGLAIEQHLRDFEISCADKDKHLASPSAYAVFRALAFENKLDGLPDNFKSAFLQAVFQGSQYPNALLSQAITRIRADRKFLILRLAGIKAYLNRLARVTQSKQKEISMALDVNNPSLGYQCGRLFACLEKIQSDSSKNLNADIRDRFYGAASATPVTVFGRLLALSKHHLAKLNPGTAIFYEQLCAEIVAHLNDFPAHLNLAEQGRFAIGYYHQRLDLYTAQKDKEKNSVFSDKNQQKEQADV